MSSFVDHDNQSNNTHPTGRSLASLPGLRGPYHEGNVLDDCASHFSLSDLPESDPVRRVTAAEVRRQALAFPPQPTLRCSYPKVFLNVEQFLLRVPGPWWEYPLLASGRYISGEPGPARVIASANDFARVDVVYHTSKTWNGFRHATYRPRGYQRPVSGYFTTESCYPLYPSLTYNGHPTSFHEGYPPYHGFEWQGHELGQAPWLVAWTQPWYDSTVHQYETYNSSMAAPIPYGFYQLPIFNLSEIKHRES
ncbi:hypothetical protein CDV31_007416 [Fusarium ambrosium]|uniref:Uncharacterized protein n=1 Tax=Fusarium ambrosium TaxID=131363 RepID=A0A428U6V6_9HYPO|nr:hypothetical protein CDV31_007416 [Fusarium ambrosium]